MYSNNVFQALGDRLLDFLFWELDERARWVKTPRPNPLLFRGKIGRMSDKAAHFIPFITYARCRGVTGAVPPLPLAIPARLKSFPSLSRQASFPGARQ